MVPKITDRLLIVEENALLRKKLMDYFLDNGFEVFEAASGTDAWDHFQSIKPDLVLTDIDIPIHGDLTLLESLLKEAPSMPVVVAIEPNAMDKVLQAIRLGASDFVAKPYASLPVVEHVVCKALERSRLIEENKQYREALEVTNAALNKNLTILKEDQEAGRSVQMRMLPEQDVRFGSYHFSHGVNPSLYLSGDFLDYFKITDNKVGFYIADVSGHGASSAFVTVLLKSLIGLSLTRFQLGKDTNILEPNQLLTMLGKELYEAKLGKYLTIVYGVLDLKTHILEYSIGGHYPNPVLVAESQAKFLEGKGFPVGIMQKSLYQKHSLNLPHYAHLVMFSDGVFEILSEANLNHKEKAILEMASKGEISVRFFQEYLKLHENINLPDDVTMLVLSRDD